jgi:hypothetical protein
MKRALLAVVALLLLAGAALADIPQMIGYQGMVTDNSGNPVSNGTYTMRFRIYTAETGGSLLWDSNNQSVTLTGGVFNAMLGESPQPALGLAFDQDYWLLVTFAGQDQTPRKRLGSVGYAYMASGVVPGTYMEGSVTAGTNSVLRAQNTAPAGTAYGIRGQSSSTSGVGLYGAVTATTGTNYGGRFYSTSTSGRGIYAYTTTTTGSTYGVYGWSASTSGRGVYGRASATTGTTYGVYGETASSLGRAVYGDATSTVSYNYGVYGRTASTVGTGVFGWAPDYDGTGNGVYGLSDSWKGKGVLGASTGTYAGGFGGWGVDGLADAVNSYGGGVRGRAPRTGGYFEDTDSGTYGYVGYDSYKISGNGTCNFVQNHPRNSERVIAYSCPEGDEVATYTRGTARLVDGEARVPLGETFKWVTNPDIGLTAHLTPRGNCHGLYVESLRTDEMVVRELEGGSSDVAFDYIVYGLRVGFEEVPILQQKEQEAYIPSMEKSRRAYAEHPDLRRYNALERFKRMTAAAGLEGSVEMTSARALRNAIEEYDPTIHGSAGADELRELRLRMEEERRRLEEERARNNREESGATEGAVDYAPASRLSE